ncbi:hypothetical protein SESBI_31599 [Sesbania bispinosa]|nr:hypothetical protein SESBI_31599 [Sesbania bispinosa]
MPPRQRPHHKIEMEELRRQLQQFQATVEIQQAQIEEQIRRLEGESYESDSLHADNHHSRKQQFRSSDIKVEIPDFEDGVKIKLAPLPPSEFNQSKKETKSLVSLVAKKQFKVTKEEAQDVIPEEIPEEIPPQRDKHRRLQTFKDEDLTINDNAYKVELPSSYGVCAIFNVADLSPYFDDEEELDSRTSPIQPGEDETAV